MKDCLNCKNHKQLLDEKRDCFVHKCREYRQFTVYGSLDGPINENCSAYDPIKVSKLARKSLREMTFIRAGGKYDRKAELNRSGIRDNAKKWE